MIERVYIAAPFQLKAEARLLRRVLNDAGISVTSRWLDGNAGDGTETAEMDLADVCSAQALVLINPARWKNEGTGGRHVEVGAALTYSMPVYVLGEPSNIFHSMRLCYVIRDEQELIGALCHDAAARAHVFSSAWMLQQLITRVHTANARWWIDLHSGAPLTRNVGELLMLVVSELAEAMEGHRKNLPDDKLPSRPMFTVELADALIRIFDIAGGMQLDVPDAFDEKMAFNARREDHTAEHRKSAHGKKY